MTRRYGTRVAVDSIALKVPSKTVVGFIGPNGAGKTTTIRMLLGLIKPTQGSGTVLGHPLSDPSKYLSHVGALIEGPTFYNSLSGKANLRVLATLGGIPPERVEQSLERVGLSKRSGDLVSSYSLGMKQRLGIAAALLPGPELLILDEPTNGLDPAGIVEVRNLFRSLADEGVTVFVSSHLLGEIQQVCDHLVIIREGKVVFQGSLQELSQARTTELIARPEKPGDASRLLQLAEQSGYKGMIDKSGNVMITAPAEWAGELNRSSMKAGITLIHLAVEKPSLEEAFFALTGNGSGDIGHISPTSQSGAEK